MGLRDLSEAIILQAASDLLGALHDKDSLDFFSGEGFRLCAQMARMDHDEKVTFLRMLTTCISECKKNENHPSKEPNLLDKRASKGETLPDRCRKSVVTNVA